MNGRIFERKAFKTLKKQNLFIFLGVNVHIYPIILFNESATNVMSDPYLPHLSYQIGNGTLGPHNTSITWGAPRIVYLRSDSDIVLTLFHRTLPSLLATNEVFLKTKSNKVR